MKMLGKLARSLAARYVCQNCADLGQIMLAKLTPTAKETKC